MGHSITKGYRYTETQLKVSGKKRYGWSKYGGAREGLVKETLDEWYCQVCSEKQSKDLPSYMLEIHPNEFVRLCSKCQNMIKEEDTFQDLRNRVWEKKNAK